MPGLRGGFVKFDGRGGNLIRTKQKANAGRPRDRSFCQLLDESLASTSMHEPLPHAHDGKWQTSHNNMDDKWQTSHNNMDDNTGGDGDGDGEISSENETAPVMWPRSQLISSKEPKFEERSISSVRVPQLKANRLDDIRHSRAKELLFEVGKKKHVQAYVAAIETSRQPRKSKNVATKSKKVLNWTPFGDEVTEEDDTQQKQHVQHNTCSKSLHAKEKQLDDIIDHKLRATVSLDSDIYDEASVIEDDEPKLADPTQRLGKRNQRVSEQPAVTDSLDMRNLLRQRDESWEESLSDILSKTSYTEDETTENDIFMAFHPTERPTEALPDPQGAPNKETKRNSLDNERKELLSPAILAGTPKEVTKVPIVPLFEPSNSTNPNPNAMLETVKADSKSKPISERATVKVMIQTGKSDHHTIKQSDVANDGSPKDQTSFPTNVEVKKGSTLRSARKEIKAKQSIHFQRNLSLTTNSLLDTESDVYSDSISETQSASISTGSLADSRIHRDLLIDTGSSGSVSTLTHPQSVTRSDNSVADQSNKERCGGKCGPSTDAKLDPEASLSVALHEKRRSCQTLSFAKPLGATTEEIAMLNTFLKVAGPALRSPTLSIEDREAIHNTALKAGLPEEFINKMLDQTAGIIRWEEQSLGTVQSTDATEAGITEACLQEDRSVKTKNTVESGMSYSTRYTQDTESISYHSYNRSNNTPKAEVDGGYGCFINFKNSFWLESGIAGDDIMESVAAVMSSESASFDESNRHKRRDTQS